MFNAARMLSNFDSFDDDFDDSYAHGVNAILRTSFTFARLDGQEVTLDAGTAIHVDEHKGYASHGKDHFEVEPSDYIVSFAN